MGLSTYYNQKADYIPSWKSIDNIEDYTYGNNDSPVTLKSNSLATTLATQNYNDNLANKVAFRDFDKLAFGDYDKLGIDTDLSKKLLDMNSSKNTGYISPWKSIDNFEDYTYDNNGLPVSLNKSNSLAATLATQNYNDKFADKVAFEDFDKLTFDNDGKLGIDAGLSKQLQGMNNTTSDKETSWSDWFKDKGNMNMLGTGFQAVSTVGSLAGLLSNLDTANQQRKLIKQQLAYNNSEMQRKHNIESAFK